MAEEGEGAGAGKRDRSQDVDPFPMGLDIEDRKKWFASKLAGLSREECILVAGRAALRVVPIWLNGSFRSAVDRYSRDTLHYVVLPILRCQFITAIASISTSQQKGAFKSAAIGSTKAIHKVAFEESEMLASLAANTAIDAVNIIMAGSDFDAVILAIQVADQATHATTLSVPNVAFYAGAVDAVVSAFLHDINYLNSGSLAELAVEPLWPTRKLGDVLGLGANEGEFRKFEIPNFFRQSWDTFERLMNEAGDGWDVWAEWFRCVVEGERVGTFLFVLPTQNALTLWRKVALLDDAIWNAGPATLNAEFKRLVEEARRESDLIRQGNNLEIDTQQNHDFETVNKIEPELKSEIGVEVIKNARFVKSQSMLLIRLIQVEIDRIKSNPANDPDTIEEQAKEVAALQECLTSVESTKAVIESFEQGDESEQTVVTEFQRFGEAMRGWFSRFVSKHEEDITRLSILSVFSSILHTTGADPTLCVLVTGSIIANKKIKGMIQAWRGQPNKE